MTAVRITPEERIFSLILALVSSPIGLTKTQLLSSVHGYANEYKQGESNLSLERKFERDKEQLRLLGIPIEVVDSPLEPGNNQLLRYRIRKSNLQIPKDLTFNEDELNLLRSAALVWSETSLSDQSRQALMKLESRGSKIDYSNFGVAPKAFINEPAVQTIHRAVHVQSSVTFEYIKPDSIATQTRRVTPYRLHRADTRWHLIGFDHNRNDWRTFLVSRIVGNPKIIARVDDIDRSVEIETVLSELETLQASQKAVITVSKNSLAFTEFEHRAKNIIFDDTLATLELETLDYVALASELTEYALDIKELAPVELFTNFKNNLKTLLKLHS